ncbi:MAG: tetratricopeptide repeat protein [Nannocystaceae bacterium]|nr:serine/threonine-protein kinase [bacterium]
MVASSDPTLAEDLGATALDTDAEAGSPSPGPIQRGQSVGRYLIVDILGAGAMGVVYRAYDPDLDRALALKVVGGAAESGSTAGSREQARLLREAQAMARVRHPNVIAVFDVGELDSAVYVAMELVDGVTLAEWLVPTRNPTEILDVFEAAGAGLAAAHAQGLTHRDFKPDNVMVDGAGQPRVLDFGLARASHRPPGESSVDESVESVRSAESPVSIDTSMTEAGTLLGTPAYMSPEQYRGEAADHRSDQFAFCVALFEALVGRRPFEGRTVSALAASVTAGRIDMPSRLPVARGLMQVIARGLSVEPQARHASMDALLAALRRQRTKSRKLGVLLAGAGLALGVGAVVGSRSAPAEPPAPCQGAADDAAEVWTDTRRAAIASRFESQAGARGTRVWGDVQQRVEAYLAGWADGRTDACEATRVRGEQSENLLDLRIACYDDQLRRVEATLVALERADKVAVDAARDAVAGFSPLERCTQAQRLLQTAPRPSDPSRLAALEALEARYAALRAEVALGHYEDALREARSLVADAEAFDDAPMLSKSLRLLGDAEGEAGTDAAAAEAYQRALHTAIVSGDADASAEAAMALGLSVGYFGADTDRGLRALELGRAFAKRSPNAERLEMFAAENEAAIDIRKGEMNEALALHQEVLDYWEQREDGKTKVANALLDMAAAYVSTGRAEEAVEATERAVELRIEAYGADHPLTANALRELGNGLSKLQRFDEAEVKLKRALEIQEGARGRTTRSVAVLLDDLGRVSRARGDLDEAIARHREAYEILSTTTGGEGPSLVVSRLNIGYTLSAASKWDEAFVEFAKALEMAERVSGPEHPQVVYAANAAASALIDQQRFDEAYTYAKKALDLDGKAEVPPTLLAETRFIATHALWKDGNVPAATKDRARALARRAREIYTEGPPQWAPYIEQIDAWLAEHG